MSSDQLGEIAAADYGYRAEEVLPLLQTIAGRGRFPDEFPFQLREVLRLVTFIDPDSSPPSAHRSLSYGQSGHHSRLFACSVMMIADIDPAISYEDDSPDSTLASAVTSASALGPDVTQVLGRFLSWRMPLAHAPEPLLTAVAILFLALSQPPRRTGPFLEPIIDWVLSTEAESQKRTQYQNRTERRPLPFSIQQGFWKPVEAALQAAAECCSPVAFKEKLQLCALLLDSGG